MKNKHKYSIGDKVFYLIQNNDFNNISIEYVEILDIVDNLFYNINHNGIRLSINESVLYDDTILLINDFKDLFDMRIFRMENHKYRTIDSLKKNYPEIIKENQRKYKLNNILDNK